MNSHLNPSLRGGKCCHYNVIKGAVQSYCGEKFSDKLSVARWKKGKRWWYGKCRTENFPQIIGSDWNYDEAARRGAPPTHQQLSRENQLSHKNTAWDSLTTEMFLEKRKILDKENY